MPSGWSHQFYFANQSTVVAPPIVSKGGGYPLWQASVVASLFGALQGLWERCVEWVRLWQRVKHLTPQSVAEALDRASQPPPKPDVVQVYVPQVIKRKAKPRSRIAQLLQRAKVRPEPVKPLTGALERAQSLMNHPAYPFAQEAVRKTATTLGFNRPEAWQGLSRHMKASPGRAENVFRHMNACQIVRNTAPSTLTNPDCNLLVELAYHDFAMKGQHGDL
jgi:hypothetical protein